MTRADAEGPSHYIELAKTSRDKKSWDRCLELWAACFHAFPDQAQPFWYSHQGSALLKLGHFEKAKLVFEECTQLFPDSVNGYIGLARTANHNKQWKEALYFWQICFARFPERMDPSWHKQKQRALSKLGDLAPPASQEDTSTQGSSAVNNVEKKGQAAGKANSQALRFRHILIITYGRSGSTLLQGLLNGIEGVVLRGENENVFFDLYKTYQKLLSLKNKYTKAVEPNRAWFGICLIDQKELLSQFQNMARTILLADQYDHYANLTYGFKEIRYNEIGEDFDDYLDFLSILFPNVAFIFNTRDLQDVAASGWWKDDDNASVVRELESLETRFRNYADGKDHCFSIRYEDVIAGGEELRDLFTFLGAKYQPEVIETILNTPHSYSPEQGHIKKMFQQ